MTISHQDFRTGETPLENTVILTHRLTREYEMGTETVKALQGVDVQIQRNEYVAITGPAGEKELQLRVPPRRITIKRRVSNTALIELNRLVNAAGQV